MQRVFGAAACAAAIVLAATAAAAQSVGQGDDFNGGGRHRAGGPGARPQKVALPEVKVKPEAWPRLDPGAVLCRSAEDFLQHRRAVAARLEGSQSIGEPTGCSVVRVATPVVVISRDGPGQTQVRVSDAPAGTGWTDAYLPDKRTSP